MRVGITKKVRIDQRQADRLARIADQLGMSETDVIREALALLEHYQDGRIQIQGAPVPTGLGLRRMLAEFETHFDQ